MHSHIKQFFQWWLPLILLSCLAFYIQTHIYIHRDVSYLLHEANLMLQGETYAKNIFEPNPPLILFLSMPPLLLSKLTNIDILYTMRFYVIFLALLSSGLSYLLIKQLFSERSLVWLVSYTVAFTLLFLPAHQFGQREQLLMIFIYPYLFAAGLRLENKKVPFLLATLIGLMAGIGFAIKPHFFATLLLIECYFIFRTKQFFGWVRPETCFIALFLFAYLFAILFFYPAYLQIIYPLWWPFYKSIVYPWYFVLTYPGFLFSLGPLFFYFYMKKYDKYQSVSSVFLLSLVGFTIAFLQPRVIWYYHILPALSVACVIYSILFAQFLLHTFKINVEKADIIFSMVLAIIFFAFPIYLTCGFLINSLQDFRRLNTFEPLIAFLAQEAPDNKFDYFANTHSLSILEFYSKAQYIGRFPSFWWFYDLSLIKFHQDLKAQQHREKYFSILYDMVADDLISKKPKFVIVDTESAGENLGIHLNYINEFSSSKSFRMAWKKYHFYKTIDRYRIYMRSE